MDEAPPEGAAAPATLDRAPAPPAAAGPAWERMEEQLQWYDSKAGHHKRWFQTLKVVQLVVAALIPVIVAAKWPSAIAGLLGAAVVVLEGIQQLFQFQQNWVSYRATAEALKHEKYLFLSRAGHYAAATRPQALLAERVEGLVSQEHAAWSAAQPESKQTQQP